MMTIRAAGLWAVFCLLTPPSSALAAEDGKGDTPATKKKISFITEDRLTPPLFADLGLAFSELQFKSGLSPDFGLQLTVGLPATPEWRYSRNTGARLYGVLRGFGGWSSIEEDHLTGVYTEFLDESPPGDFISIDERGGQSLSIFMMGIALRHYLGSRYFFDLEGGWAWDRLTLSNKGDDVELPWSTGNLLKRKAKEAFATPYVGVNVGGVLNHLGQGYDGVAVTGGLRLQRFRSITDGQPVYSSDFDEVYYPADGRFVFTVHVSVSLLFGHDTFQAPEPAAIEPVIIKPAPKDEDEEGGPEENPPTDIQPSAPPQLPPPPPKAELRPEECAVSIDTPILFDTNEDTILPESEPVLAAVAQVLLDHPELTLIEVQGHTDHHGEDPENFDLSIRRVSSVVKALVGKGISPTRLTSRGFGETRLLFEPPTTPEQDARNRRVEFKIVEGPGCGQDRSAP